MNDPFQGQERCLEEERKVQAVVSEPVPSYQLEYFREHPSLKEYMFQDHYFEYHRNHPIFQNTEYLNGKIVYAL